MNWNVSEPDVCACAMFAEMIETPFDTRTLMSDDASYFYFFTRIMLFVWCRAAHGFSWPLIIQYSKAKHFRLHLEPVFFFIWTTKMCIRFFLFDVFFIMYRWMDDVRYLIAFWSGVLCWLSIIWWVFDRYAQHATCVKIWSNFVMG